MATRTAANALVARAEADIPLEPARRYSGPAIAAGRRGSNDGGHRSPHRSTNGGHALRVPTGENRHLVQSAPAPRARQTSLRVRAPRQKPPRRHAIETRARSTQRRLEILHIRIRIKGRTRLERRGNVAVNSASRRLPSSSVAVDCQSPIPACRRKPSRMSQNRGCITNWPNLSAFSRHADLLVKS